MKKLTNDHMTTISGGELPSVDCSSYWGGWAGAVLATGYFLASGAANPLNQWSSTRAIKAACSDID